MPGADVCDWTGRGLDGRTGGRWRNIRARCARMRCSGGTPARPGGELPGRPQRPIARIGYAASAPAARTGHDAAPPPSIAWTLVTETWQGAPSAMSAGGLAKRGTIMATSTTKLTYY